MMLRINENGNFQNPPPTDEAAKRKQDDEIFHVSSAFVRFFGVGADADPIEQRARLVNSGYFAKIVLHDYVGGILGLTRDCSPWRLNLTQAMRQGDHEIAPTGHGGAVSCEFNLLYRWHSTTSEPDAAWIGEVFKRIANGKDVKALKVEDFAKAAMTNMGRTPKDPRQWTFGGLGSLFPLIQFMSDAELTRES
jgi:linoleate 10R-lipoxygenase